MLQSETARSNGASQMDSELTSTFEKMHRLSRKENVTGFERRRAHIDAVEKLMMDHKDEWLDAIDADFGGRSKHETLLTEFLVVMNSIKEARKHLKDWMRPQRRVPGILFQPGSAKVMYQPLGVVGVIGPWNYPVQLNLLPLLGALIAGNRVMMKPSELTPRTTALLKKLVEQYFNPQEVCVVTGGAELGAAFALLPFDLLFFTGSTSVGQKVMQAAAQNLTPVVLELGGKSPVIIDEHFNVRTAAERIVRGKMINSGQTCIAPDYILVSKDKMDDFVEAVQDQVKKMYPTYVNNPDFTSVINERHHQRLTKLLSGAQEAGVEIIKVNPSSETFPESTRKMALHLLLNPQADLDVMKDEIFGPLLPIIPYDTLDDAILHVNERPRPLALYLFSEDNRIQEKVLEKTTSGGVTINDTLMHCAVEALPFGGVGPSGMGAYHGEESFRTFSHEKGIFVQAKVNAGGLASPPFGRAVDTLLKFFVG